MIRIAAILLLVVAALAGCEANDCQGQGNPAQNHWECEAAR